MRKRSETKREKRLSPRLRWILLGLATVALRAVLGFFPGIVEQIYSRGLYIGIRRAMNLLFGGWPISVFSLLVVLLMVLLVRRWRKRRKHRRENKVHWSFLKHLGEAAFNFAALCCAILFFFNVLWGINYNRIPLEKQLELQVRGLDVEALCEEMEWAAREMEKARAAIPSVTDDSLSFALMPDNLPELVNDDLQAALDNLGFPTPGRVRIRIAPGGTFLRLGIGGIYNPFTGEGNIAGALTPQRYPATMAHEMSHGYGFGEEGECNLLAIIACEQSQYPFIRYSGLLSYWGYTANELRKLDPLLYQMLRHVLAPGIRADLRANYHNYYRYDGAASRIGNQVNDAYLQTQGVKEGVNSYNRVVNLYAGFRKRSEE